MSSDSSPVDFHIGTAKTPRAFTKHQSASDFSSDSIVYDIGHHRGPCHLV